MILSHATISDVKILQTTGPWDTKSGGVLNVLFSLNKDVLDNFFSYESLELSITKEDIRGLRVYRVSQIKKARIGANEWHRIRCEIVSVIKGRVLWKLQDTQGNQIEHILDPTNNSLLIPPYIMHTYEALEDDSEILVIANTIFIVNDDTTHDTYPESEFPICQ